MKLMNDFKEKADELKNDLNLHGATIAAAVRTNSIVVLLVAAVSALALLIGVTALRRTAR